MKKNIGLNSIISTRATVKLPLAGEDGKTLVTTMHTIAIVNEMKGKELYCKEAITSLNGSPYQPMKEINPEYEGELLPDVSLITSEEFDILIDSNLIQRSKIKNPKQE